MFTEPKHIVQGYLIKKKGKKSILGNFIKRYFMLDIVSLTFSYKSKNTANKCSKVIYSKQIIRFEKSAKTEGPHGWKYGFSIYTIPRIYMLYADTLENYNKWINGFQMLPCTFKPSNRNESKIDEERTFDNKDNINDSTCESKKNECINQKQRSIIKYPAKKIVIIKGKLPISATNEAITAKSIQKIQPCRCESNTRLAKQLKWNMVIENYEDKRYNECKCAEPQITRLSTKNSVVSNPIVARPLRSFARHSSIQYITDIGDVLLS